jgi:hypothetical protein
MTTTAKGEMVRRPTARLWLPTERADRDKPRAVRLVTDRGLASGKLDIFDLPPDEAVELATELLVSAQQARKNDAERRKSTTGKARRTDHGHVAR